MRGNATRYPDRKMTQAAAERQLNDALLNARDEALERMTVEGLHKMFNVDLRLIECKLLAARAARARRVAK